MSRIGDLSEALPIERLEHDFDDAKPLYTDSEALIEANRCLFCHDAPCITACPTDIDIPAFIRKITTGNLRGAAKTILSANMTGATTARVCPVEVLCVGDCVINDLNGKPINIGRLQRYVTTKAMETESSSGVPLFEHQPSVGKSVALVGAGPASLAAAGYLALAGVDVTIYEKSDLPGGLNTTGIAPYKLKSDDSLSEVAWILSHGVKLETGVEIGRDTTLDDLAQANDALFIGVGLGADTMLPLPGSDGDGVFGATELIRRIKNDRLFDIPEDISSVLVVGAGNTAIDIARELAMLGLPDVELVYRRTERQMSGYAHELEGARAYGVKLIEQVTPMEVIRENGAVVGLKVRDMINDEVVDLPCDWIVMAVGQSKVGAFTAEGIAYDEKGLLIVDDETRQTGNPKIYAGGDCINGGKEVVNAAADGRDAALHMLSNWGIDNPVT